MLVYNWRFNDCARHSKLMHIIPQIVYSECWTNTIWPLTHLIKLEETTKLGWKQYFAQIWRSLSTHFTRAVHIRMYASQTDWHRYTCSPRASALGRLHRRCTNSFGAHLYTVACVIHCTYASVDSQRFQPTSIHFYSACVCAVHGS